MTALTRPLQPSPVKISYTFTKENFLNKIATDLEVKHLFQKADSSHH